MCVKFYSLNFFLFFFFFLFSFLLQEFKDPEKAMSLFQESCAKKSPGACNNAGLMYQKGVKGSTIEKDLPKAIELFTKACDYGHRNGCFNLSAIYLTGKDGIPKDMKKAFELSLKSCEMSHPWGCVNVSRMYTLGDGVEKNPQEAEKFKRLAKLYSGQDSTPISWDKFYCQCNCSKLVISPLHQCIITRLKHLGGHFKNE